MCQGARDIDPKYAATLRDMEALINRLKVLNSRVNILHIHGPGEPLLWKLFNQAIRLFVKSGLFNKIELVTNGIALKAIEEDVWPYLSVFWSRYPGVVINEEIVKKFKERIIVLPREIVYKIDKYPRTVTGSCSCCGPCYFKRKIFPRCGPPVFDAAKRIGVDPFLFAVDIEKWDPGVAYALNPPCEWCWSNDTFSTATETVLHKFR